MAETAGTPRDARALGRLLVRKGLERHVRKPALRYVEDRGGSGWSNNANST